MQRGVQAVAGVQSFEWSAPRAEARIVRIVGRADTPSLLAACAAAGTKATVVAIAQRGFSLHKQLHCNGCVIKVKRAPKAVKGTKEVHVADDRRSVSDDRRSVSVVYDRRLATVASLFEALAGVDSPASPLD